jgi:hypothetical protein
MMTLYTKREGSRSGLVEIMAKKITGSFQIKILIECHTIDVGVGFKRQPR